MFRDWQLATLCLCHFIVLVLGFQTSIGWRTKTSGIDDASHMFIFATQRNIDLLRSSGGDRGRVIEM